MYVFVRFLLLVALRVVWRYRAVGVENVPLDGPLIVACNHVSYFDPPALGCAFPRPIHYMAKQYLFTIPLFGPLIRQIYAFPVDRKRGEIGAIRRSVEVLRTGAAVGIFPEGTRNKSGTLQPQSGVALLHYLSGAPILPAYVKGTDRWRRLSRISVAYGAPIVLATPGQKASREDLAKWTAQIMDRVRALGETLGGD
jgi:1-acyl-sn-glycerol-3-phosphate acyltransferase